MNPFSANIDIRTSLRIVKKTGAAFVEAALDEKFRARLESEVDAMPFEPMSREEGTALQEGDIFIIHGDPDQYVFIGQLRDKLVELVHHHGHQIQGCAAWRPNEISVQRYAEQSLGITPHLDLKRYRYLVAVFTAVGRAPFTLCRNRAGEPIGTWQAGPGSLVLMRGPGFAGIEDDRPIHTVGGPQFGHRVSVSFRMNTRP